MQESSDFQVTAPLHLKHASGRNYERTEMPHVEPVLRVLARQCPFFRKFPLFRVLKNVARLLLITHTESLFLLFVIRETHWGAGELWMKTYAGKVRDLLCFQYDEREYREMLLYLLLASYSVKECLNGRQPALLRRATKICPDFNTALRQWSQRHASTITGIHPRMLNRLYSELWNQSRQSYPEDLSDYTSTVDEILEICRPYSETRVERQKERMNTLRREAESDLWQQKPQKKRKMQKKVEAPVELCASFTVVEFETVDPDEELKYTIDQSSSRNETLGLPDCVPNEDEQFCESYNLYPEEEQSQRIFIRNDHKYDHYFLRFICEDSDSQLL